MKWIAPIRYMRSHWAGDQGFGWSFWVNLVALRLLISVGQSVLVSATGGDISAHRPVLIAAGLFAHGLVFIWQVVGVLRSGENHIRAMGSVVNSWGAFVGILVAFWLAVSDMWGVWIVTIASPAEQGCSARMDREHASRYDLSLEGDAIVFEGEIDLGATRAVGALLVANPEVTVLILTSPGGNIYEARGLANLARSKGLSTKVRDSCTSSCTVAFIGGVSRHISKEARMGFHQYRISADYKVLLADPAAEQARDIELFRQAGVADWFLEQIFKERPEGMWIPTIDELRSAGVVTQQ